MYSIAKTLYSQNQNNRIFRAIFSYFADKKTAEQQKHDQAFNTFTDAMTSIYCLNIAQGIMDYLDGKIDELPENVKACYAN